MRGRCVATRRDGTCNYPGEVRYLKVVTLSRGGNRGFLAMAWNMNVLHCSATVGVSERCDVWMQESIFVCLGP